MTNKELLLKFLDAFGRGDGKSQYALLHPEVEIRDPDSLPYGGSYRGHDGWRALNRAIFATWENIASTTPRVIGEENGEEFAVFGHISGVSKKTGKAFDSDVFEYWRIVDGSIVQIRPFYWDTQAVNLIAG